MGLVFNPHYEVIVSDNDEDDVSGVGLIYDPSGSAKQFERAFHLVYHAVNYVVTMAETTDFEIDNVNVLSLLDMPEQEVSVALDNIFSDCGDCRFRQENRKSHRGKS